MIEEEAGRLAAPPTTMGEQNVSGRLPWRRATAAEASSEGRTEVAALIVLTIILLGLVVTGFIIYEGGAGRPFPSPWANDQGHLHAP